MPPRSVLLGVVNIPFSYYLCEGKIVCSEKYEGYILNISAGGMFALTNNEVESFLNIKFRLYLNALGRESDDIYGKILRVKQKSGIFEVNVEFTAIQPGDRQALKELVDHVLKGS